MIRVLHIIKSLGRGGAEMLLQETLARHDKTRFEFHYIYFLPWKNQMVDGLLRNGGKVLNIPAKDNVRIMMSTGKIVEYIRKNKIDLVHCHLPWAGFAGRFIFSKIKIPVIYTEHNKQERYHKITRAINKFSFNRQTAAVAVSDDVAESINQNIHPNVPVHTILNGVNTSHFRRDAKAGLMLRSKLGISEDSIVVGTIAVFRFQKRLKEWILVMKDVCSANKKVKGILVGDGILIEEIKSFIREQNMEDHIILPGLQTDVLPWMSAIDIYLMTSQFEGLPIALLEAMSMECAIVTTDAGGIKEVVRNNIDGFMQPVDQWQQLSSPILELAKSKNLISEWGERARQRVIEKFSIDKMVAETEKLYLSIVHGNN